MLPFTNEVWLKDSLDSAEPKLKEKIVWVHFLPNFIEISAKFLDFLQTSWPTFKIPDFFPILQTFQTCRHHGTGECWICLCMPHFASSCQKLHRAFNMYEHATVGMLGCDSLWWTNSQWIESCSAWGKPRLLPVAVCYKAGTCGLH